MTAGAPPRDDAPDRPAGRQDQVFVKRRADAPPGYFAVEAAGLRWLAGVPGGVRVVEPLEVAADRLVMPRLPEVAPTPGAAEELGRRLAVTHAAGAPAWGAGPAGWTGDGYVGPLPLPLRTGETWGPWFAEHRLLPYLRRAHDAGAVDAGQSATVSRLLDRLVVDEALTDAAERPSRLHGDLWNGNVMWTRDGVVLVDPAAHGGHRETDLAMLALFGLPHLARVLAAYDEAAPLSEGWQDRAPLHQLHPLLVHAALFGGGYGAQAAAAAARFA